MRAKSAVNSLNAIRMGAYDSRRLRYSVALRVATSAGMRIDVKEAKTAPSAPPETGVSPTPRLLSAFKAKGTGLSVIASKPVRREIFPAMPERMRSLAALSTTMNPFWPEILSRPLRISPFRRSSSWITGDTLELWRNTWPTIELDPSGAMTIVTVSFDALLRDRARKANAFTRRGK